MPSRLKIAALVFLLLAGIPGAARAEATDRPAPSGGVLSLLPLPQTTEHSITIAGRTLQYQAKAGTLSLLSGTGDVTAEIFYVAYTIYRRTPFRTASSDRSPSSSTAVRARRRPICISARWDRAS